MKLFDQDDIHTFVFACFIGFSINRCAACNGRDEFNERAREAGSITRVDHEGEPLCFDDAGLEWCWDD